MAGNKNRVQPAAGTANTVHANCFHCCDVCPNLYGVLYQASPADACNCAINADHTVSTCPYPPSDMP